MRIGVVSDTHGYLDPRLVPLLHGVDEILHAGDVGSEAVLDQLRAIAPVEAVRGNVDSSALGLALTVRRRLGGVQIYMLHKLPKPQSALREWAQPVPLTGKSEEHCHRFMQNFPEDCRVVIFGHSHEPCALVLDGRLFFNPGSAGKRRFSLPRCFGILQITAQAVHATFQGLEGYNEGLPEGVALPLEGAKA
jgi:uncharacterized protein